MGQRFAFVEDVVQYDDGAAGDVRARHHFPHHLSALVVVAVATDVNVVEFKREGQLRQQVAGEDHGAAHHAQHQRKLLAVWTIETLVKGAGHRRDGAVHGLFAEQLFRVIQQGAGAVMVEVLHDLLRLLKTCGNIAIIRHIPQPRISLDLRNTYL